MKTLFILISLFFAVSLSARQRDSRVREYLPPARIVWQQESQLIQGANHLLLSGNGQSNLVNHNICKLSSTDRQHPAILLDFGKELQGGLQIVTGMPASHEPVAVRIRLGESVSEARYRWGERCFQRSCHARFYYSPTLVGGYGSGEFRVSVCPD